MLVTLESKYGKIILNRVCTKHRITQGNPEERKIRSLTNVVGAYVAKWQLQ